jgi:hypothetical protein
MLVHCRSASQIIFTLDEEKQVELGVFLSTGTLVGNSMGSAKIQPHLLFMSLVPYPPLIASVHAVYMSCTHASKDFPKNLCVTHTCCDQLPCLLEVGMKMSGLFRSTDIGGANSSMVLTWHFAQL